MLIVTSSEVVLHIKYDSMIEKPAARALPGSAITNQNVCSVSDLYSFRLFVTSRFFIPKTKTIDMPPISSSIMGVQGLFGILNGAATLLFPSAAEKNLQVLEFNSLPALHSIALGSITVGYAFLTIIFISAIIVLSYYNRLASNYNIESFTLMRRITTIGERCG